MAKIKDYLIASETNDYRPFITSTTSVVFFIVIIWGLRLLLPAGVTFAQSFIDSADVMKRINDERYSRNIPTVTTNDKLISAAQNKANDMLDRSYFSHVDPDGNYVWPLIEAAGYKPYTTLGENLAMDFTSASELVAAWMNSPTHRSNMLNSQFQDQGVAQASGEFEAGHDTTIVVSLFGRLAKSSGSGSTAPISTSGSSDSIKFGTEQEVSLTQVSGHNLVDVTITIDGSPKLVTARLLTQAITLLPKTGTNKYSGTFTFNLTDNLNNEKVIIEARDAAGAKITAEIPLSNLATAPEEEQPSPVSESNGLLPQIPVSTEAQVIKILRIIFGVLSVIYLAFLVIDWIIVKRAHVDRPGLHLAPQIAIFMIVAFLNLFVKL